MSAQGRTCTEGRTADTRRVTTPTDSVHPPRSAPTSAVRSVRALLVGSVLALLGGLALGLVTNLLQGVLPGAFAAFANAGSIWVTAAFAAGAIAAAPGWRSTLPGAATQVGAVVGYYAFAQFGRDGMGDPSWPLFWLVAGLVVGPLLGAAGAWLRTTGRRQWAGPSLLGAVFGMDALNYLVALHYDADAAMFGALGVLAVLLLERSWQNRLKGIALAAGLAALAASVSYVVLSVVGRTA
jgi:hypothetical protein